MQRYWVGGQETAREISLPAPQCEVIAGILCLIGGLARKARGAENCSFVIPQNFEPVPYIVRVTNGRLGRQRCAKIGRCKLGAEFFACMVRCPEPSGEVPSKPRRVTGPVSEFVKCCSIIIDLVVESLLRWNSNIIVVRTIKGAIATNPEVSSRSLDHCFSDRLDFPIL